MKRILYLLMAGAFLPACNNHKSQTGARTADTTTQAIAPADIDACYKYVTGKDSVLMHLNTGGSIVTGDLIYSFFGKDQNTGTIQGRMKGDTIFADYTFMSEGTESVREIALLKKGNALVEGYGEVKETGNKMVFVNTGTLNFNTSTVLSKTDCQEDTHGCLPAMGYIWSALTNECIRLSQTGIRMNPVSHAGGSEKSAFVVFSDDQSRAELFLPQDKNPLLMERKGTEGSYYWENGPMRLYPWKGYVLKQGEKVLYAGR